MTKVQLYIRNSLSNGAVRVIEEQILAGTGDDKSITIGYNGNQDKSVGYFQVDSKNNIYIEAFTGDKNNPTFKPFTFGLRMGDLTDAHEEQGVNYYQGTDYRASVDVSFMKTDSNPDSAFKCLLSGFVQEYFSIIITDYEPGT